MDGIDFSDATVEGDIATALARESYVQAPATILRGDPEAALAGAPHRLTAEFSVGGQEHFYLEGQIGYALPLEQNQWRVYSSTQHPAEVQHWIAHALGLENHDVLVECRRMGGGFGGKESQSALFACVAAVAARKLGRPVKLRLDRDDDFMVTGKRHPFAYDYEVGFDDRGRILDDHGHARRHQDPIESRRDGVRRLPGREPGHLQVVREEQVHCAIRRHPLLAAHLVGVPHLDGEQVAGGNGARRRRRGGGVVVLDPGELPGAGAAAPENGGGEQPNHFKRREAHAGFSC